MTNKDALDEMLHSGEELQNQYLEEAVAGLQDEVAKELQPKLKAHYLPNTWRYEEERVNRIVEGLKTNIEVEKQNSTYGKKMFYEEDDLSNFMSDAAVKKAVEMQNKPYFARIDYLENDQKLGKTLYISEYDFATDIINWRNPLMELYYKKNFDERLFINQQHVQLERYRYITISGGELVELHTEQTGHGEVDTLLIERLAEKRGDEMRKLVDTLQAEQYELISLPIEHSIVVQGSAGSGKSVIALHRLSYILYNHSQLQAKKVAIFGPNTLFLKHIEKVLPELGEQDIVQTTMKLYIEALIPLRVRVQEVERMILSEIHDLSINEGKAEALKEFEAYSNMRKIKGSLAYKQYIERYTKYITANLVPFIRTLSLGNYCVSGLELATFFSKEKHYGDSRAHVKQFVEAQIKEKAKAVAQIYEKIGAIIEQEVAHFLQLLQQQNVLHISHSAIDWQMQRVRDLQNKHEEITTQSAAKNYAAIFSATEFRKLSAITDSKVQQLKMKELASKKASDITHELSAAKNKLKNALHKFIELKVAELKASVADFVMIRPEAQQALAMQQQEYCALFYRQYALEQATELFTAGEYVTRVDLEQFIQEVNAEYLDVIYESWVVKREQLLTALQQKITAHVQACFAQQLEQLMLQHFAEVAAYGITLKSSKVESHLTEQQSLPFAELMKEIDTLYIDFADEVYDAILTDQYAYAEQIDKDWNHESLKDFKIIEKHDLPALYTIYKQIAPSFDKPFQYMIVDEAQDYTLFEMDMLNDLTEQIMLMGDLGQNLTPSNEIHSWQQFEEVIGTFNYYELKATYRSTKQIVDFSNELIQSFSKDKYNLPLLTFRNGERVETWSRTGSLIYQGIRELVNQLLEKEDEQSKIAIIAKTVREATYLYEQLDNPHVKLQVGNEYADSRVIITTPVQAKGLEFDTVILFRFSRFSKTDEHDTKLAYVAASRALHKLHVYS